MGNLGRKITIQVRLNLYRQKVILLVLKGIVFFVKLLHGRPYKPILKTGRN
ncbi:hypothetical protein ACS0TY_021978 [Phlomoides rotata]